MDSLINVCGTMEILDRTSQDAPHLRKSWTEPHKLCPIPGNPGQNLTRCAPSPEIPNKTHKMRPIPGNSGQNFTRFAPSPEIPDKPSQDAPQSPEIPDKTSHDETHPRKSWTIYHKVRPIPGNPGQNLTRFRGPKMAGYFREVPLRDLQDRPRPAL